jgi:predicted membrane protein
MNLTLRTDAIITAMAIAFVIAITLIKGDVLFIEHWYYASVFLGVFILSALVKAKPLFISGAILAAGLTFGVYIQANWVPSATNDLLVLGHLFSLPGAAIGLLITGIISRFSKHYKPALAFAAGTLGFGVGFLMNQAFLCNTVLYCGALLGA